MTNIVSKDPTHQVRKARTNHACWAANKWFRSPMCSGRIKKGATYVAKVELGFVAGRQRWFQDLRHICAHCALHTLTCIKVEEDKVA